MKIINIDTKLRWIIIEPQSKDDFLLGYVIDWV